MPKFTRNAWTISGLTAVSLLAQAAFSGPALAVPGTSSDLYITVVSSKTIYDVNGTTVVNSISPTYCNHCEIPIAVDGDVRTTAQYDTQGVPPAGGQYTLGLVETGTTYPSFPFAGNNSARLYDGTTNGTYNFAVGTDGTTAGVYRMDRNWSNPVLAFVPLDPRADIGSFGAYGITFDPRNNSFWISYAATYDGVSEVVIGDFATDGTLLNKFFEAPTDGFNAGSGQPVTPSADALALDYTDWTLWTLRGPAYAFDQYDTSGNLLQSVSFGLTGQNGYGMEFNLALATIPEPAGLGFLGIGAVGLLRRMRRGRV